MQKAKLQRYRAMLKGRLATLAAHMPESEDREGTAGPVSDPSDRASVEEERAFELHLLDRDRKLIAKIKEALKRIDAGTFGVCEGCGQPIDEKRLQARPVTTLCIGCKEEREQMEKRQA